MSQQWTDALGTSEVFLAFQDRLALMAGTERPILVLGERGTGKELAVQRLHYSSSRWEKPLVTVLCPAISPSLLESELFGHEVGSFTGARGRRIGYFERADKGTIFLDEVADMPLPLQDKLLRVIEYGSLERVGGHAPITVDVRILAATNRNLLELAEKGQFRADLLDRLCFDVLHVPPLRIRGEDKLLLARHFAVRMAMELKLPGFNRDRTGPAELEQTESELIPYFGEKALNQLENHDWPGNIRELKNAVERAVLHSGSLHVEELDLNPLAAFALDRQMSVAASEAAKPVPAQPALADSTPDLPPGFDLAQAVADLEKNSVRTAMRQAKFRQAEAARLLGFSYHQFRAVYRKYKADLEQ